VNRPRFWQSANAADDLSESVSACNIQSRKDELDHIDNKWAHANNLKLNREKSSEIVITGKSQRQDCDPTELSDIRRTTSLTVLGVSFTNHTY